MTRPTFPGGGRAAVIGYLLALATASGIGCRQDVQGQTTQEEPPRHTNALIHSDSPYLLQHAHNPVNWMPWGPEAFEIARREDKPIFVSIGYSTCYWCHVMERESFEDEEVARVMNEHYVCIKVDREQRPDIDQQLMLATQLMTGRGGWPNSVWLTPDGRPFVAGTYFPRDQFLAALKELARIWR
ncbi:MAG: thioredoxin domain-containing protein, partial [Planctomycetota bacterium]